MKHIVFEYRDGYSNGEWKQQECVCSSIKECIEWYGLNECEWRLISIEDVD